MCIADVVKERPQIQLLPGYLSRSTPELPHCGSVPLEPVEGIRFFDDDVPDVEGTPVSRANA